MVQKEKVYPVGAGPGEPDLITRKALRVLAMTRGRADVQAPAVVVIGEVVCCRTRLLPAVGMEAAA